MGNQNNTDPIPNIIALLAILVKRAGGTMVIPNLSEFAGQTFRIGVETDPKNDCAIITLGIDAKDIQ